jgi:RNA polymerase sigma-70 factor (ECF subfamily)
VAAADRDEARLVRDSVAGDKLAFAELVRRYRSFVMALVYRLCGDAAQAEDIAQDAFLRVWQALPSFRGQAAFRTWLYRVASNVAIEQLRHAKPTVDIESIPLAAQDTPEDTALRTEQSRAVRYAVLHLPLQCRLVLILREYEGLSYKEIASTLDIPIGTVMSRLNYARQRLHRDLAPYIQPSAVEEPS